MLAYRTGVDSVGKGAGVEMSDEQEKPKTTFRFVNAEDVAEGEEAVWYELARLQRKISQVIFDDEGKFPHLRMILALEAMVSCISTIAGAYHRVAGIDLFDGVIDALIDESQLATLDRESAEYKEALAHWKHNRDYPLTGFLGIPELLANIEACGYTCDKGGDLAKNADWLELKRLAGMEGGK